MNSFLRPLSLIAGVMLLSSACSSNDESGSVSDTSAIDTATTEAEVSTSTLPPTTTLPDRNSPETQEQFFVRLQDDYFRTLPGVWEEALDMCVRLDEGWTMKQFFDSFMTRVNGTMNFDMDKTTIFNAAVEMICPEHLSILSQ